MQRPSHPQAGASYDCELIALSNAAEFGGACLHLSLNLSLNLSLSLLRMPARRRRIGTARSY